MAVTCSAVAAVEECIDHGNCKGASRWSCACSAADLSQARCQGPQEL